MMRLQLVNCGYFLISYKVSKSPLAEICWRGGQRGHTKRRTTNGRMSGVACVNVGAN